MDNGCEKCAKLSGNKLCPACEIGMLDACMSADMRRIEELKKELESEKPFIERKKK